MASYRKIYFYICLVLDPCERQTAAVLMVETVGLAHAHDASARLSRRSPPCAHRPLAPDQPRSRGQPSTPPGRLRAQRRPWTAHRAPVLGSGV
jgi:hypothetical protein